MVGYEVTVYKFISYRYFLFFVTLDFVSHAQIKYTLKVVLVDGFIAVCLLQSIYNLNAWFKLLK